MPSKLVRGCILPGLSWPIGRVKGVRLGAALATSRTTGSGGAAGGGAGGGGRDGGGDFVVAKKRTEAAAEAARLRRLAHARPFVLPVLQWCAGGE